MVEWGNNSLKQVVGRLQIKLSDDDENNSRLYKAAILLYNWRVSTCDRSQINTLFKILENNEDEDFTSEDA